MRGLRTLVLELTLAESVEPRRFCGYQDVGSFPWSELEHLSLSHPSVDDAVYMHLPQQIRILDLSCYPHLAERLWLHATVREYGFPVPTSSEMLDILRRCSALPLLDLHLKFRADERESELLRDSSPPPSRDSRTTEPSMSCARRLGRLRAGRLC
ncbi:hypothetical protein C8T65DRAFT_776294 [Cerioporus squamosus]|nr:hypothetical protein C8T65DRAFT_776294 [Cerioporus squamosus]